MKLLMWVIVLVGLYYGGSYLYQQGYFDSVLESFGHTVSRTSDFATDRAVKEANF